MRHPAAYRWLGLLALAVALLAGPAWAGEQGRVPAPVPPKGIGQQCVAPVAEMRRYHMDYLSHQRDDTVRGGIRGAKFSLRDCIACHAVPAKAAQRSVEPFCDACHVYAAVKIDCFECHNATTTGPARVPVRFPSGGSKKE